MKKIGLLVGATLFMSVSFGQEQLPNSGFEDWDDVGTATMEPTHWSSLKTADALASMAPNVISRVEGRNGGYAVKLVVKEAFLIQANGVLTNGRVHADMNPENGFMFTQSDDERWYTEFSARPDSLVGWYKYNPKNGDQGKVEVLMHKGTEGRLPTNQATVDNTIATARYDIVEATDEWTRFSTPFNYKSEEDSDYILVVIAAGDSTLSKKDTELIVDDIELIYGSSSISEVTKTEIAVNGSKGYLYFGVEDNQNVKYTVVDVAGKIVQQGKALPQVPFRHDNGIYMIYIETPTEAFTKKLYINQY